MKKNNNKIVFLALFLILGVLASYNFLHGKVEFISGNTESKNIVTCNKSNNTTSIVLYNSHADEGYASGKKVTDVAYSINNKFNKEGFKSNFIKCDPSKDYVKSYENARKVLKSNIKNFDNTILLDIHSDIAENNKSNNNILIQLSKKNPHYAANRDFAEKLLKEINKSNKVKCSIQEFNAEKSYFNQDLSNNSVLIELGNNKSSDSEIEEYANVLVTAIKNIKL